MLFVTRHVQKTFLSLLNTQQYAKDHQVLAMGLDHLPVHFHPSVLIKMKYIEL